MKKHSIHSLLNENNTIKKQYNQLALMTTQLKNENNILKNNPDDDKKNDIHTKTIQVLQMKNAELNRKLREEPPVGASNDDTHIYDLNDYAEEVHHHHHHHRLPVPIPPPHVIVKRPIVLQYEEKQKYPPWYNRRYGRSYDYYNPYADV